MGEKRCTRCGGSGFYYLAPKGVNTFLVRIEQLAKMLRKVECSCRAALQERPDD